MESQPPITRYQSIADEVSAFAQKEMDAARLPGAQFGPADAYRHMVAAGELTRRLGPVAGVLLETNELRSWFHDTRHMLTGADRHPAHSVAARAMDRHNNAIGVEIGRTAATPEEVVERARQAIAQAEGWGGSGHQGTAFWMERRKWNEPRPQEGQPPRDGSNWPNPGWHDLADTPHLRAYPGRQAAPGRRANPDAQCPVPVSPHIRSGHPVRGYIRACPPYGASPG